MRQHSIYPLQWNFSWSNLYLEDGYVIADGLCVEFLRFSSDQLSTLGQRTCVHLCYVDESRMMSNHVSNWFPCLVRDHPRCRTVCQNYAFLIDTRKGNTALMLETYGAPNLLTASLIDTDYTSHYIAVNSSLWTWLRQSLTAYRGHPTLGSHYWR